jgi:hypothetical protein
MSQGASGTFSENERNNYIGRLNELQQLTTMLQEKRKDHGEKEQQAATAYRNLTAKRQSVIDHDKVRTELDAVVFT